MKPITSQEVCKSRQNRIPDFVIEAFNNLITKNLNNMDNPDGAYIGQNEIIKEIIMCAIKTNQQVTPQQIFENKWFEIENLYSKAGWKVTYILGVSFMFEAI